MFVFIFFNVHIRIEKSRLRSLVEAKRKPVGDGGVERVRLYGDGTVPENSVKIPAETTGYLNLTTSTYSNNISHARLPGKIANDIVNFIK